MSDKLKIPNGDYVVEVVSTSPNVFDTVYSESAGNRPWSRQSAGHHIDKNSRGRVDIMISIVDNVDFNGVRFADTLNFDGDEDELHKVDIYEAATHCNLEREHPESMMFIPFNARVRNNQIIGMYPVSRIVHFSMGAPGPQLDTDSYAEAA
jgi:hypothetical protein